MSEDRPLRILHLCSSHRWTGAAEPATDLARAQIELGHDARFVCAEGHSFWRMLEKRGVPRFPGFYFERGVRFGLVAQDVRRLRRLLRENDFDVIHCHLENAHWLAAGALLGNPGRKKGNGTGRRPILVRTFHRDKPPYDDRLSKRLCADVTDLSIGVSREGLRVLIETLDLDPDKATFIPGAVDLERFHPGIPASANRDAWKIPRDAPVAGMVARMQPYRGHFEFIDTMLEVGRALPELRYILAGRGESKLRLEAKRQAHLLRRQLMRVGYRSKDLPETYASFDVSVLLSKGSDGTCRAMLEAMACARPVIGVNEGAIADTIEHGKTGWLVDRASLHEDLTRVLIEALSDREATRKMGEAARAAVEQRFTQKGRATATLDAYRTALERRAA